MSKKPEKKITIVFIINGENYPIETNTDAPLLAARAKALAESENTGRNPDEWEIRDEAGSKLDASSTPKQLNLADGVRLFLSLAVGAGG